MRIGLPGQFEIEFDAAPSETNYQRMDVWLLGEKLTAPDNTFYLPALRSNLPREIEVFEQSAAWPSSPSTSSPAEDYSRLEGAEWSSRVLDLETPTSFCVCFGHHKRGQAHIVLKVPAMEEYPIARRGLVVDAAVQPTEFARVLRELSRLVAGVSVLKTPNPK